METITDERIVYKTKTHWIVFRQPLISFLVFLFFISLGDKIGAVSVPIFVFLLVPGILEACILLLRQVFVITDKRIIMKTSRIKIKIFAVPHEEIESIDVRQRGVLAKKFNYGTIIIGVKGRKKVFKNIRAPRDFLESLKKEYPQLKN